MVDAVGAKHIYTYDQRGRLIAVTAHTRTTRFGYDAFGNMTSAVLPTGKKLGYEYDGANRLTKMRDGMGGFVNYSSDTEGNRTREIVYGSTGILKDHKLVYDTNNRLERVTNPTLSVTNMVYGYDNNGNVVSASDHNNHTTNYSYDDLDRLLTVTLPNPGDDTGTIPTSYEYDVNDNATYIKDGKNNAATKVYDDMGRLVETADAENNIVRYEYDAVGNLVKLKDENSNITTFEYNELDLLKKKTYADGHYETFEYYPDGRLHIKTNARGITATYAYDPDTCDLLNVTYSDNTPTVTYTYYAGGLVHTRIDGAGTYSYTYDGNGRMQTVDGPWNNDTLTHYYDGLDRVTKIEQQGGEMVEYLYDTLGRLDYVEAGARIFDYAYTSANLVADSLTRPSGSFTTYTYDNLYRLKSITNKKSDGTVVNGNAFTYNKAHMRTQEVVTNGEPLNLAWNMVSYSYNNVNQLTNSGFACDNDGNMTSFYTPDNYVATATYDAENRLKAVQYTDSNNVAHNYLFSYDADGLLAKQIIDGVEARFVRDPITLNVLQERDANNLVTRTYTWDPTAPGGIGGLLEMTQNGQHYYYLYDGKGNVSAVIDSNQQVVAAYRYDPVGKLLSKSGTLDQPYQFSTKYYLAAIGKSYFGYRWYDPITGKWLTHDPMGEAGGGNLYKAMGNSAVNKIDPLGLLARFDPGSGGSVRMPGPVDYGPFGNGPPNMNYTYDGKAHPYQNCMLRCLSKFAIKQVAGLMQDSIIKNIGLAAGVATGATEAYLLYTYLVPLSYDLYELNECFKKCNKDGGNCNEK